MDKRSIQLILKECFEKEGNGAYLHFIDGSQLLIGLYPKFFNLHMQVKNEYDINCERVSEIVCIPYSSIIYITLTNAENLRIIAKQYERVKDPLDIEGDF